jgi:hypothetical protein
VGAANGSRGHRSHGADETPRRRHPSRARGSAKELTHHKALRVTTIPQTLLDLAATGWPIDRLTHEAAAASLVSLDALKTFAANRRGARGAAKLNQALGLPHTRSGWERRFLRWLKTLEGIELDTEQTHGTPGLRSATGAATSGSGVAARP